MIVEQSTHIIDEVKKAFIGKDEIIRKVLMTVYAGGHILLEDCPGVGKTTLALVFSKVLGLSYKRIQTSLSTGKARQIASCCWRTKSIGLRLRLRPLFWKSWKSTR